MASSIKGWHGAGVEGAPVRRPMGVATKSGASAAGFTLIEVITVFVLLAVLAAVAIPRYISMVDSARTAALEGAVAAGLSHVSLSFGRLALQKAGQVPTVEEIVVDTTAHPLQSADYVFSFLATATPGVQITVAETDDASMTATREWRLP
ncbi:MAG TPA: hypothetical protein DCM68_07800 [Verrucomicrobia bacterium]|nr:hypothetical protein [Verrucomicrobiota bacterium]